MSLIGAHVDLQNADLGPDIEVGTAVGARLLGIQPRTLRAWCDEGVLREQLHWRQYRPHAPIFIRRRALMAKKLGWF